MNSRPVGMFDSGAGGLSVLQHFLRLAPSERVVYFADTAAFPYGPRPAAEVRKRSFAVTRRLIESGVKLIVVACNTASAAAINDLREAFPVPFVGMVPGVKPAAARSASGRVAILATEGTLDGELYERVVQEFGRGAIIENIPGTGLAEMVEAGECDTPAVHQRLRDLLGPAIAHGADTVVLGCTHYHFLGAAITAGFPGVTIIDTTEAVARRAVQVLEEAGLRAEPRHAGGIDLIVSGDRAAFRVTMARLGITPSPGEALA